MSTEDHRSFLEDLIQRFDPTLSVAEGSSVQAEVIEPILARIGTSPLDTDISQFLLGRLQAQFPQLDLSVLSVFRDVLVDALRVIIEPLSREINLVRLRSSLLNVNLMNDEEVDALLANFFERRVTGAYASGMVRVYFASPRSVTFSVAHPVTTRTGLRFFPTVPQQVTQQQMMLNEEDGQYFVDIEYQAEYPGEGYNVDARQIVSIVNMSTATKVSNLIRFQGGAERESSIEFQARVETAATDSTLTTEPGIGNLLGKAFPQLRSLKVVGFGDEEMHRDIISTTSPGGIQPGATGLGSVLDREGVDGQGSYIHVGSSVVNDYLSGAPTGWSVTLAHITSGAMGDFELIGASVDTLQIDGMFPQGQVVFSLRTRSLQLSSTEGGILSGGVVTELGSIHVGGKTDIYASGPLVRDTVELGILSDSSPLAQGTTGGYVSGTSNFSVPLVVHYSPGMILTVKSGDDSGDYLVQSASDDGSTTTLVVNHTWTVSDLSASWELSERVNMSLTAPEDTKVYGAEVLLRGGSTSVAVTDGTDMVASGVAEGDLLEVTSPAVSSGLYTVTSVAPNSIEVRPPLARTEATATCRIYTAGEAVRTPIVAIEKVELLDDTGSPTGVTIPLADPTGVDIQLGNRGSEILWYTGPGFTGLVSGPIPTSISEIWHLVMTVIYEDGSTVALSTSFPPSPDPVTAAATYISSNLPRTIVTTGVDSSGQPRILISGTRDDEVIWIEYGELEGDATGDTWPLFLPGSSNADIEVPKGTAPQGITVTANGESFVAYGGSGNRTRLTRGVSSLGPEGSGYRSIARGSLPAFAASIGAQIDIGQPSTGTARVWFKDPVTSWFGADTRFGVGEDLFRVDTSYAGAYSPLPEEDAYVLTDASVSDGQLTLTSELFLESVGLRVGDFISVESLLQQGTAVDESVVLSIAGLNFMARLHDGSVVGFSFPNDMTIVQAVDYINEKAGTDICETVPEAGNLVRFAIYSGLGPVDLLDIPAAFAMGVGSTKHPAFGIYEVVSVNDDIIVTTGPDIPNIGWVSTRQGVRIYRQGVGITSANMLLNQQNGLYYFDIPIQSQAPGAFVRTNGGVGVLSGYESEGYRLTTRSTNLSYSRFEDVNMTSTNLVTPETSKGSRDDLIMAGGSRALVTYLRSALVDDMQSYVYSKNFRNVCRDPLARHLLPHFLSLDWAYTGGPSEADALSLIQKAIRDTDATTTLEVGALTHLLRSQGARSVVNRDGTDPTVSVIHHSIDRKIRSIVTAGSVDTPPNRAFYPLNIQLKRRV